ncbi:hypothetical protein EJ02DRAFT_458040 [Clathrospora elynae]|uniref:Uncharacterized protein n=1 Tax=Clathrospora elynae TaxID=706981 RepID=A0A6A5SI64_9PLEO|nr:hypothetical protein EJ02DRAFT_458040 [Clathrospora elynae]
MASPPLTEPGSVQLTERAELSQRAKRRPANKELLEASKRRRTGLSRQAGQTARQVQHQDRRRSARPRQGISPPSHTAKGSSSSGRWIPSPRRVTLPTPLF